MKTRIISALCGVLIFAAIIVLSTDLVLSTGYPIIMIIAVSLLAAIGAYEILHNTGIVKNNIIAGISCVSAFMLTLLFSVRSGTTIAIMAYFAFVAVLLTVSLFIHDKTSYAELAAAQAYTFFLSFAFSCMVNVLNYFGFGAFLLIFVFAWGSDTFAYFTGVFLGKHKLCPALSPKKTVEGAVGGILGCMLCTLIVCLVRNANGAGVNVVAITLFSALFSVLGMVGDISASYIKRAVGIKDYGNIMPGHGGVLDRFDSVLLIAPVYYTVLSLIAAIGS